MTPAIRHLHHVTATVDQAAPDLDFCQGDLGLRLVKRTVNFDNHGVYHLYYATETGAPGTVWTTFPYHGWGVRSGAHGAGQVAATAFSIPAAALDRWRARLRASGITVRQGERFGNPVLSFSDPSGLRMELIGDARDQRPAWRAGPVDSSIAIRGLHSATLLLRSARPTLAFMSDLFGARVVDEGAGRTRVAVGGDAPGGLVDLVTSADAPAAQNGLGTVHHVAFAVDGAQAQLDIRRELLDRGVPVTEVRDRTYFQSIYFREPGGVLFEVATMQPGFTVDEPLESLGRELRLPPWEEPRRSAIETMLPPLPR